MTLLWIIGLVLFGVASTHQRIVGGKRIEIEKYPSIVQVDFLGQSGAWSHSCGGSILTARYILSAAHCFTGLNSDANFRRIRAGATQTNRGGLIFYVARAINHPSYRMNDTEGDISVVQLILPLPSTPSIQQATIASRGTVVPGNLPVELAGWGAIFPGPFPSVLQEVTVHTINKRLCAQRYRDYHIPLDMTENVICAGVLNVGGYACNNDGGGPMYFKGIIVGVISRSYYCSNGTLPGITTSVGPYTDWIVANAV